MKSVISFVAVLATHGAIGCGGATTPASSGPTADKFTFDASLAGKTFQTACVQDNPSDPTDTWFRYEVLSFVKNSYTLTIHQFSANDCDAKAAEEINDQTFLQVVPEVTPDFDGWTTYVFDRGPQTMTTLTESHTYNANYDHEYGYTDWVVGQPKDISGRKFNANSQPNGATGSPGKMSLRLNGNTLSRAMWENGVESVTNAEVYTLTQ